VTDPVEQLALWCSLAVVAEPQLVRSLRLELVPEADAGVEADLWWSSLLESRTTRGIVLKAAEAQAFRSELRKLHRRDDPRPARAWEIVQAYHRRISPAVKLEEEIAWQYVDLDQPGPVIEKLLRTALVALVNERRTGLGPWAGRALPRLPKVAREQPSAWYLEQEAHAQLPHLGALGTVPPADIDPVVLAQLAGRMRSAPLGVLRVGDRLYLGDVGVDGHAIEVPATDPRVVEVVGPREGSPPQTSGGSGVTRRSVAVPAAGLERVEVGWGPVTLQSAFGNRYELPPLDGLYRQLERVIVRVVNRRTGSFRLGVLVSRNLIATTWSDETDSLEVTSIDGADALAATVVRRHGSAVLLHWDARVVPTPLPVRGLRRPPERGRRWYGIAVSPTGNASTVTMTGLVRDPAFDDLPGGPILLQARYELTAIETVVRQGGPLVIGGENLTLVANGGPVIVDGEIAGLVTQLVRGADFGGDGDLIYGEWSDLWTLLFPAAAQATPERWLVALADLVQGLCLELHSEFRPLGVVQLRNDQLTGPQLDELRMLAETTVAGTVRDLLTAREVLADPTRSAEEAATVVNLDLRAELTANDPRSAEPVLPASVAGLLPVLREREASQVFGQRELNIIRIETVLAPAWRAIRDRLASMGTPGFSPNQDLTAFLAALLGTYHRIFARVADDHGTQAYAMGYSLSADTLEVLPVRQLFDLEELEPAGDRRHLAADRFETIVSLFDWGRTELLDAVGALDMEVAAPPQPPPGQPERPRDVQGGRRFVVLDRSALRSAVRQLMSPFGQRILVVNGPPGSGKSFTAQFIQRVAEQTGAFQVAYVDLDRALGPVPGAVDLAETLALQMGESASLPRPEGSPARQVRELAYWLVGRAVASDRDWWWVLDGLSSPALPDDLRDLVLVLADQIAGASAPLRLVLLGFDQQLPSSKFVIYEQLTSIGARDVADFLTELLTSLGRDLDPAQIGEATRAVLDGLPPDPDRLRVLSERVSQLAEAISVA
jgi:hypothetical protein